MSVYSLRGIKPTLPAADRHWIAPNATVIGNVELKEDAAVWFNVCARGDHERITIGARSNVQENCVLHVDPGFPVTIGADTTVGHSAIVHGCTIGDGVIVGMGAVIMNGASIGDGSIVAAGAVVPEGKSFPPRSLLVGAPAKVAREMDEEAVTRLKKVAERYVDNWKSMACELKLIG